MGILLWDKTGQGYFTVG